MKLFDRQAVDGTSPVVYIGRRVFLNRQGLEQVAGRWCAECCHRGQTHYASLKTASRSVALHRAHQMADKIRTQPAGAAPRRIDLTELSRQYLTMQVNQNRSPKTIQAYENGLASFVAWANARFAGPADAFTDEMFWEFHKTLVDAGYADKTRAARLVLVKQLFKWAALRGKIEKNPLQLARVEEASARPQPCFQPEQVRALLDAAADPLERAVFAVLAYAGLRFGEARALRWADVVMPPDRPGHLAVRDGGSRGKTKSGKPRRIPLHPELRLLLDALPRVGDHVFYAPPSRRAPDGGRQLNQSTWLKQVKQACARCGFVNPRQFKLHSFRHSFASMCARNNVSYRYALAWMGHQSSDILNHYISEFDDVADQAMSTIVYPSNPASKTGGASPAGVEAPRKDSL